MKKTLKTFLKFLLLPALLGALPACQGADPTGEPAGETERPPSASPTTRLVETPGPQTTETTPGPSGLAGQVLYASDVSGQPDEPLADQMVLAIPVEKAGEILGSGAEELTDEKLRFLKANLLQADPALAVTLSDAAGNYTLRLAAGEYVLCLADSEVSPLGFPATTRGCGRTSVPPGALRRVDISSGFGEILLVEK